MPSDRDLLARIGRSAGGRAGYKQLIRELGLGGGRERRLLLEQLARLTARGALVKADRDHWTLPQAAQARTNLIAGRLDLHRDGFGFVRPNTPGGKKTPPAVLTIQISSSPRPSLTAPCRATSCSSSCSRTALMAQTPASAPAASSRSLTAETPPS